MTARLLIRASDGTVQSIDVGEGLEIGSAPTNDVVLTESLIAPVHARVRLSDGGPCVEDAGSDAGTWVNGERVTRRELKHLDIITLGRHIDLVFLQGESVSEAPGQGTVLFDGAASVPSHLLRVSALGDAPAQATRFEAVAAQGPPGELLMSKLPLPGGLPPEAVFGFKEVGPPPNPSAPAPEMDPDLTRLEPALIAPRRGPSDARERPIIGIRLSGKNGSFECSLGRSVVGRGSSASIRIKSKEMSREHAVIVITPTEVTVEDQQSANGTSLNGTRITGTRRLIDGDRLVFSSLEFGVEILRTSRGR